MSTKSADVLRETIVAGSAGVGIAALFTLIRLAIRFWRRTRLSWDDAFAILAMMLLIVAVVAGYLFCSINSERTLSQHSRVVVYYLCVTTFHIVVWTARLSMLSSIIRLGCYTTHLRIAAGIFCTAMVFLVAQLFWTCEPQDAHNHWKSAIPPQCVVGSGVAIAEVSTDAFADIVLVSAPLLILRFLKSKTDRLRLSVSFAVGGLTTIVSIVHAYYVINADLKQVLTVIIQASVSVTICNFPVIAAALHRTWSRIHPHASEKDYSAEALQSLRFGDRFETGDQSTILRTESE